MRISFSSKKSMLIWGIVWIITGAIAGGLYEVSPLLFIPFIYWTYAGSAISDLVADKDWDGLKHFLKISTIVIAVIVIIVFTFFRD